MNERDAQELIRMAESNWHMDLGPARAMWRTELMLYNAEVVTHALAELAKSKPFKITLADLMEAIHSMEELARRQANEERRRAEEARAVQEGKRGYATPQWVHVWVWARNRTILAWEKGRVAHKDRSYKSFPQMGDWADPANTMTTAEYEALREEWAAAGAPKEKLGDLVEVA